MEQEKQDQLIQEIINDLNFTGATSGMYYRAEKNISESDWYDMMAFLIREKIIEENVEQSDVYYITNEGRRFVGDKYLQLNRNEREKKQLELTKQLERERKEAEKLDTDLTLAKWQKKVFWPVLIGGAVGGVCGIISLWIQLNTKPVVKYVGVDSKGHTLELPNR
ncbi:MAG TPA: hypothetical protein PLL00_05705 [Bacteroidia bacterium]|nr:hypothetical protein [Bacteroidia bacterium]